MRGRPPPPRRWARSLIAASAVEQGGGAGALRASSGEVRLGVLGVERREYAELVPLRVGHDRPLDVGTLADGGGLCTKSKEAPHLRRLVRGAKVEVQPVLRRFAIGNLDEEKVGGHIHLRAPLRRLYHRLMGILVGDPPAQRPGPKSSERLTIVGVDDETLDADGHRVRVAVPASRPTYRRGCGGSGLMPNLRASDPIAAVVRLHDASSTSRTSGGVEGFSSARATGVMTLLPSSIQVGV